MPRPKLPKDQVKETVGIKLAPAVIAELEQIGAAQDSTPSAVGREFLLLGMAVYRASKGNEFISELITSDTIRDRDEPAKNAPHGDDDEGRIISGGKG